MGKIQNVVTVFTTKTTTRTHLEQEVTVIDTGHLCIVVFRSSIKAFQKCSLPQSYVKARTGDFNVKPSLFFFEKKSIGTGTLLLQGSRAETF